MRKYQAIWEQIKRDQAATIICAEPMHSRIINAVRKEKRMDYGWKLLVAEDNKKYRLMDIAEGNLIKFRLEEVTVINIFTL